MQAGLSEEDAAPGPDLAASKYRAMHAALKALSEAPGAVPSGKLRALMADELRKSGKDGASALARELEDGLVKCNIITGDSPGDGHKFSSRGAQWYFNAKCATPHCLAARVGLTRTTAA